MPSPARRMAWDSAEARGGGAGGEEVRSRRVVRPEERPAKVKGTREPPWRARSQRTGREKAAEAEGAGEAVVVEAVEEEGAQRMARGKVMLERRAGRACGWVCVLWGGPREGATVRQAKDGKFRGNKVERKRLQAGRLPVHLLLFPLPLGAPSHLPEDLPRHPARRLHRCPHVLHTLLVGGNLQGSPLPSFDLFEPSGGREPVLAAEALERLAGLPTGAKGGLGGWAPEPISRVGLPRAEGGDVDDEAPGGGGGGDGPVGEAEAAEKRGD